MAMPDVFSIRHTTVEAYLEPIVHEVKVQRSDLLADLRRAAKREAYLQLGGECWYVIRRRHRRAGRDPAASAACSSPSADRARRVARPAPRRPARMTFPPLDGARPGDAGRGLAPRGRAGRAGRRRGAGADDADCRRRCVAEPVEAAVARQDRRARRALWLALLLVLLWGANFTRAEGDLHRPVAGRLPVRPLPHHAGRGGAAAVLRATAGAGRGSRAPTPAPCCGSG